MQKSLISTLAGAALLAGSLGAQAEGDLYFYNWTDYTPEDLLEKFEKDTGIKVTMDTYDSNETLLAKLKSGATGYDLAVPSSNFVTIMVAEGLLEQVDVKSMPNYKYVDERWQGPAWDPDQMYTSPYQYGTTSFAIRTDAANVSCESLKYFFEPEGEACGNLSVFKTPEEVVSMAQLYLGQQYCQDDSDALKAIQALLQKQNQCTKVYSSEGMIDRMATKTVTITNAWNGDAMRAREEGTPIEYCYPKEGVVGWFDSLVIPKGAKNIENAKTFMNWLMAPENMALVSNFARYANAIPESTQYLDPELATAPENNPPAGVEVRVSETCGPRFIKAVDKIWTGLLQ
ncbi:MAG: extracellular solute-binding protein [Thiohalobacterales bacterium]|nr:extracellular solute-binding protein [Thiohalobacterales bacterium]